MSWQITFWVKECNYARCNINSQHQQAYFNLFTFLHKSGSIFFPFVDFIEQFPRSKQKDVTLVVLPRLTKYHHFIPLSHPSYDATVAQLFPDYVFKFHGAIIVSNKLVTSLFWKEFFMGRGTQLANSTAYEAHTDGQTERLNQCREDYLRCMTHQQPAAWCKCLPLDNWWYNNI